MISTLADLSTGSEAILQSVGGERAYRRRLLELGFVPGTTLKMIRRVELGDVLEVELRHSRVSLRISEAKALTLEPAQ
ncbi:MAG: Fe2+ transport system protein FeoA [Pseudohongiellaceae bacterium]|jgi:Fe2+ transport system protein FeoA